ncbi:unnamed protein product [Psylliodes chrysocephalus]|uniref:Major facilitator superfamily (MFS) profile domain-containing protein n=1 Tax=Psylliodes chrysocephalus TaxID=3402493 RepID=A0A9P0CZ27_9CUCU|nr:unnamed protein product [Psylliodes chrysocephala]
MKMGCFKPTIEVSLLITFFSFELLGSVGTNLMIYRTCYLILGYNETECALLGNTNNKTIEKLEKLVQPTVNIIDTTKSMIEQIITLGVCIFTAQLSDKYGRKPVLIVAQIGMVLGLFIMAVFSYFPNISPWYFLFASIPSMLTGGFSTFLVVTLSYISDVTTEDTRGVRMAIMEGIIGLGILCGSISSSYLFYATNYPSVYAIAGGISTLGIIYTIFFVPESLKNINREGEITVKNLLMSFNFKELFKVFTKKRPNYDRAIIFLMTAMLTLYIFGQSSGNKTFLFLTSKFTWTLTEYTWYTSISSIFFMIGGIFGTLIIHKYLKTTESVAVLMGFMSEMNGFLVRGLATRSRDIYLSAGVKLLGGIISPQCRTLVARLVPTDEVAKLFSLITVVESVCGIAASPFFTLIYNSTVNIDPAIYNFVVAGLCGICVILAVIIIILENLSTQNYSELTNDEDRASSNSEGVIESTPTITVN